MNSVQPKIIFLPGNGGSTVNDNWFPYVQRELEKLHLTVISRTFPDNHLARSSFWLPFLKDELQADENSVLLGHSSGAVAAMRFAEENSLLGSILVSASYTDLGEESEKISGYFSSPWKWENIKKNQRWIVQFSSMDDPYIPIAESRYIHEHLNSEYFEYSDEGHFGWDKRKNEFPEVIQIIKDKLRLN